MRWIVFLCYTDPRFAPQCKHNSQPFLNNETFMHCLILFKKTPRKKCALKAKPLIDLKHLDCKL